MSTPRGFTAISRIDQLPDDIEPLRLEAAAGGFEFVSRLVEEWRSGVEDFSLPEEAFFEARVRERLVGVGGVSIDPYLSADPPIGRIRHLYVAEDMRGRGVGSALLQVILAHAKGNFRHVRLRVGDPTADPFYRARGFTPVTDRDDATHEIFLRSAQDVVLE